MERDQQPEKRKRKFPTGTILIIAFILIVVAFNVYLIRNNLLSLFYRIGSGNLARGIFLFPFAVIAYVTLFRGLGALIENVLEQKARETKYPRLYFVWFAIQVISTLAFLIFILF